MEDESPSMLEGSLEARCEHIGECFMIFAFDDSSARPLREFLKSGLDRQLGKCDGCIVGYYKLKKKLIKKLRGFAPSDADVKPDD